MVFRIGQRARILVFLACLGVASPSVSGQVGRQTTVSVEGNELRTRAAYCVSNCRQPDGTVGVAFGLPDIVWTYDDDVHPAPIPESLGLSETVNSAWVGQDLNEHALQRFIIDGNGVPTQTIPGVTPSELVVAAAQEADLVVYLEEMTSVVLRGYDSQSNIPLWTFSVPSPYTNINRDSLAVSRDGSVVAVAVRDDGPPEATRVYFLSGVTGALIDSIDYADRVASVDLTDDGSSCLVMNQGNARLVDTSNGTDSMVGNTLGSTSPARISGDGDVVVMGGFLELRVLVHNGVVYETAVHHMDNSMAFQAVGVSRDGSTAVVMGVDFTAGYLETVTLVFDISSESLIDQHTTTGTGGLQDVPSDVAISDDGEVIAVASWGVEGNEHPEVMVFDRDVNLIGSLDTVGSALALDMTGDGAYLVAGSKAIHANISGSGGSTTMYQVYERCTPGVRYVDIDAAPGGDGSSWASAFNDLQDALDASCAGVDIYVAEGTYRPSQAIEESDARSVTFVLIDGVALYGGFAGGETSLDERDPVAHETILSGDIAGNDVAAGDRFADNAYHVVWANGVSGSAILSGFTVTGGLADGPSGPQQRGGGAHIEDASPTITHCRFLGNRAMQRGGGVYNRNGHPLISDCEFRFNEAGILGGGGLYNDIQGADIRRCGFYSNTTTSSGGAVHNFGSFVIAMSDCEFVDNRASAGGAIANNAGPNLTLVNGFFAGNVANAGGLGPAFGGAMMNLGGTTHLFNCAFVGNRAEAGSTLTAGGAMLNYSNTGTFYNCTWFGNDATESGGGMLNVDASDIQLHSCLLWGNTDTMGSNNGETAQIFLEESKDPNVLSVAYSSIQGWTGTIVGLFNDANDPMFVDPDGADNMLGTADDNLRLLPSSPAINTGQPLVPPMAEFGDLAGRPRVLCEPVDRGAYESGLADFDCDGDVDLFDLADMQICFSGGEALMPPACHQFDADNDGQVDLGDWQALMSEMTGALVQP